MIANTQLLRPSAGQSNVVPVSPDARLEFTFDQGDADLSRDGQNLVLSFGDGGTLILEGFYNNFGEGAKPPTLIVEGSELPGEAFLAALNNPDLMPAAGPTATQMGGGAYEDALLAGVDGVDKLDKLLFDGWGRSTEVSEHYDAEDEEEAALEPAINIRFPDDGWGSGGWLPPGWAPGGSRPGGWDPDGTGSGGTGSGGTDPGGTLPGLTVPEGWGPKPGGWEPGGTGPGGTGQGGPGSGGSGYGGGEPGESGPGGTDPGGTVPKDPGGTDPGGPPLDFILSASGLTLTVNEAYLIGGSAGTDYSYISGFAPVIIISNDGIGSITVGNNIYAVVGDTLPDFPVQGIPGNLGTWFLCDPAVYPPISDLGNGQYQLTLVYVFDKAYTHEEILDAEGNPRNTAFDVDGLVITAHSVNGASSGSVSVGVNVIDDVPFITGDDVGNLTLGTALVDESLAALGGAYTDGIPSATLTAGAAQAQFATRYGADGQGAPDVYSLQLDGDKVPSGLYAVNPNAYAENPAAPDYQGTEITLSQSGNVITGSADGKDYFTLTIEPGTGAVTLELLGNI